MACAVSLTDKTRPMSKMNWTIHYSSTTFTLYSKPVTFYLQYSHSFFHPEVQTSPLHCAHIHNYTNGVQAGFIWFQWSVLWHMKTGIAHWKFCANAEGMFTHFCCKWTLQIWFVCSYVIKEVASIIQRPFLSILISTHNTFRGEGQQ